MEIEELYTWISV